MIAFKLFLGFLRIVFAFILYSDISVSFFTQVSILGLTCKLCNDLFFNYFLLETTSFRLYVILFLKPV